MANEITIRATLSGTKSGRTVSATPSKTLDMTGTVGINNMQSVGTSNEALTFGDCVPGYVLLVNTDSANYVEIFLDNANAQLMSKLNAGEFCLVRRTSATLFARANTASCIVQVVALDA